MALTSQNTGSLYPGGNAKTVFRYKGDSGADMYTVPSGRILYVSDSFRCRLKYNNNLPVHATGGNTTAEHHKPWWCTGGLTIESSNGGASFIGVEFDA